MEVNVTYEDGEPGTVRFPYNIKAEMDGSKAVIDAGDSLYLMLSEEAKEQMQDELWKFDFVETIEVVNDE